MATIAQQWIERVIPRGRGQAIQQAYEQALQQGVEEGWLAVRREVACRLLRLHDVATVSELTELSIDEVTRLKQESEGGSCCEFEPNKE